MRKAERIGSGEAAPLPVGTDDWHTHADLPVRSRVGRWRSVATAVVFAVFFLLVVLFLVNKRFQWGIVRQYVLDNRIIKGVGVTLELTVVSMVLALILAVVVALMRLSSNWAARYAATAFVWFFRSVPVLVLLILTFNFGLLYPRITIGIPGGPTLFSHQTNTLISPFWAAIAAFALNEAAYASEILRSSILAVSRGQWEAGRAVGMTIGQIYRRVVLPQAIRTAIPPLGNDTINMLKGTSLVAFIAVFDLMYTAQSIYTLNYDVVPLLVVVTIWYVVMVSLLTLLQSYLERRLRRPGRRGTGRPARVSLVPATPVVPVQAVGPTPIEEA